MWDWLASTWARMKFGEYAKAFLRVMEVVSSVLGFALPIVESLERLKESWQGDTEDANKLVEFVRQEVPDEPHPSIVVSRVYDPRHVGETLFGVGVWLLKQRVPDSAPYAKLAIELAYLLLTMRNKLR